MQCGEAEAVDYSMPLHVWALFSMIAISVFGAVLPMLGKRYRALHVPPTIFKLGRCFGAGVILGTCFM